MSLLVLNYLNLAELSPAETVIAAGHGGFKAAGVRLTAHRRGEPGPEIVTDEGALADLRRKASDSGVTIATMSTYRFLPDTNVADYGPVLEAGAALGVTTMAVNCFTPDEPLAVDNLATVAEAAAAFKIKLALEFIPVSSVKTVADAARVMTATGQRNVGINVDALHLHRSGGSPEDLHKIDPALIHSVHLCDVPLAAPADLFAEMRSGRLYPGEGELPLYELLDAVPRDIELEVEVPHVRVAHLPPDERARRAFDATQAFLARYARRRGPAAA